MAIPHNKTSQEVVHKWCLEHNMELLDPPFKGTNVKHAWFCKIHNEKQVHRFDKIRHHGRIKCCANWHKQNSKLNEVLKFAEQHKVEIVGEFRGTQTKTKWKCKMHNNIYEKTYFTFKRLKDKRLPCCQEQDPKECKRYYTKQVREIAALTGYELVDKEYKGIRFPHKWYCEKHNQIRITTFKSIKEGRKLRCCSGEYRSGERHPNFNKHISEEQRIKDRRADINKRWSANVRNRDNYRCVICEHNQRCIAHHLNSYMAYPETRHDVDNGVTLCRKCHSYFHKLYGNRMNTKQQFEDFRKRII